MKQAYLLSLCLFARVAFAQTMDAPHANLDYQGPDSVSHAANVEIKNTGSTTLTVVVKRISETMTNTHETYFCWFECYDPSMSLSPVPIVLAPQESTLKFEGWVNPMHVPGNDEVSYSFYDQGGNSDTLNLTFTYAFGPNGIEELTVSENSLSIFVNENKTASINYVAGSVRNAKIQISNMLGKVQKEIRLDGRTGNVKVPVGELVPGIYFCALNVGGKFVASKKFFISQ